METIEEIKTAIAQLSPEAQTKPILNALASLLESSSSDQALAAMRQEVDALKAAPSHSAGLCNKEECQPCRDAKTAIGHQVQEDIIQAFEGAATRYGLKPELALLAEAVKHHRADDSAWSPFGHENRPFLEVTK